MKLTDYMKVNALEAENIFIIDGPTGTKSIFAKNAADSLFNMISQADFMSKMSMDKVLTASSVGQNDKILIGVDGQVKAMLAKDAFFSFLDEFISVEGRNAVYRGKTHGIGIQVQDEYREQLSKKTYKGLFLGDGWSLGVNNVTFRIGAFRYPLISNIAGAKVATILVGDRMMDSSLQFSTDIVNTGYFSSNARNYIQQNYVPRVENVLGERFIDNTCCIRYASKLDPTTKDVLSMSMDNCHGDFLSVEMIYGNRPIGYEGGVSKEEGLVGVMQLPIFKLLPEYVYNPQAMTWWTSTLIKGKVGIVTVYGGCTWSDPLNKYATRIWFPTNG